MCVHLQRYLIYNDTLFDLLCRFTGTMHMWLNLFSNTCFCRAHWRDHTHYASVYVRDDTWTCIVVWRNQLMMTTTTAHTHSHSTCTHIYCRKKTTAQRVSPRDRFARATPLSDLGTTLANESLNTIARARKPKHAPTPTKTHTHTQKTRPPQIRRYYLICGVSFRGQLKNPVRS